MPETLTATKIDNPQHPWTIEETVDGYRGTRWYVVNTGNVAAAIQATGIPRMGDYWDATRFPRLQVRSVGPPGFLQLPKAPHHQLDPSYFV